MNHSLARYHFKIDCGLPLSRAVRLALPITGRFFTEAMPPQFVGPEKQPSEIKK
jgi:hypothetical protein